MRTRRLNSATPGTRAGRYASAEVTTFQGHSASQRVASLTEETDALLDGIDQTLATSQLRLTSQPREGLRAARQVPRASRGRSTILRGTLRWRTLGPDHYRLSSDEWAEYLTDGDDDD